MVVETGSNRFLGAFGSNYYRPWVFPLYTPSGQTVIQEFPFDHPFHSGAFVSQNPVVVGERRANLWAMPPRRSADDALFEHVGRIDTSSGITATPHATGVRFFVACNWLDDAENPMLEEVRTVDIFACDDATICDITSQKFATFGDIEYPRTKFGSIGIRVEPRLLPPLGGTVIADNDRRGNADVVHEQDSRFLAYENAITGSSTCGVALSILEPDAKGPWFVRDYGMAIYNPTWTDSIATPQGDDWTIACRIIAYDDSLSEDRMDRWLKLPYVKPE
jgi:hypothetical protein